MNFMFKFEGLSPVDEVAIYTCLCIISYSCFSSLSMKSEVNSRMTVTNEPVTD